MPEKDLTEVPMSTLPDCDICKLELNTSGVEAASDMKTNDGRWGYVCNEHFVTHTPQQLGTGKGQRLVLKGDSVVDPNDTPEHSPGD